jgi:hypothetical protein
VRRRGLGSVSPVDGPISGCGIAECMGRGQLDCSKFEDCPGTYRKWMPL